MNWHLENKVVTELPDTYGFIYQLTLVKDGFEFFYIGKCKIVEDKVIPALKSLKLREGATRVYRNILTDENGHIIRSKKDRAAARKRGLIAKRQPYDKLSAPGTKWLKYEGSSDETVGYEIIHKEILDTIPIAKLSTKWYTYMENYHLYSKEVLLDKQYLNANISGHLFKSDFPAK